MYHTGAGAWPIWGDGDGWGRPPVPDPSDPRTPDPSQPMTPSAMHPRTSIVQAPHALGATHAAQHIDLELCERGIACISPLHGTWGVGGVFTLPSPSGAACH